MNVLNAIELYAQKIVKMVNFMLCIFYHSQKLHINIESFRTKESRAADTWHGLPLSDLTPLPLSHSLLIVI